LEGGRRKRGAEVVGKPLLGGSSGRRTTSALFDKVWVKRAPSYATDKEPVDLIDAYVPRRDYSMEIMGLVGLLVGLSGGPEIGVPEYWVTGSVARSGTWGIRTLEGALHALPA